MAGCRVATFEHRQTQDVYQCLKLVSRAGCGRIVRYAFEYARAQGRRKVSCFTKDNIMKLTDGLFHQVFREIRAEYPEIEREHLIVDIGAARLADTPEQFDVHAGGIISLPAAGGPAGHGPRDAAPARARDNDGAARPAGHGAQERVLVGIDVFIHSRRPVDDIVDPLREAAGPLFELTMVTNRGVKVWPEGLPETCCTDHWRCRFMGRPGKRLNKAVVIDLLRSLAGIGVEFVKTEHLFTFDGAPGFSMGQGQ